MGKLNIVSRSYGVADRFSDGTIELNKHLDKYPKLKRSIILHEIKHTREVGFTKRDFLHDLSTPDQINLFAMMKFIVRHPLALIQFLPAYYTLKRGWIIDLNLGIIYIIISAVVGIGIFIGFVL